MRETGEKSPRGPILVVDDERFFQELMGKVLEAEGYQVVIAGSGEEALEQFHRHPVRVVVLDLILPDLLGTEVLLRMREEDPEVAVIMVTAYASLESAISALKAGAYDYIQKPIVREDLLSAVERAVERQHLAIRNRTLVEELSSRLEDLHAMSREKEEVFRILHEGLVILAPDGGIIDLNPKAGEILGADKTTFIGRDFSAEVFPLPSTLFAAATSSEPVRTVVQRILPDGQTQAVDIAVLPFRRGTGENGSFLVALSDITEKMNLERRRDEFLSIISHDLRTPLTSLKGFVELLLAGKYDSEKAMREYLGILDAEADRMIALINDLLDLSRIDEGKMELRREACFAEDLVLYAARGMEGLASRRGVTLPLAESGEGRHRLFVDRQRLIQVLVNLYSNAIRFSPRGGVVTTSVVSGGDDVVLAVSDQGPGIPPEDRERIFEKYQQLGNPAPERARGSGLGLTIVRKLVELHGGTVHVEGLPQGSRFVIHLHAGKDD